MLILHASGLNRKGAGKKELWTSSSLCGRWATNVYEGDVYLEEGDLKLACSDFSAYPMFDQLIPLRDWSKKQIRSMVNIDAWSMTKLGFSQKICFLTFTDETKGQFFISTDDMPLIRELELNPQVMDPYLCSGKSLAINLADLVELGFMTSRRYYRLKRSVVKKEERFRSLCKNRQEEYPVDVAKVCLCSLERKLSKDLEVRESIHVTEQIHELERVVRCYE